MTPPRLYAQLATGAPLALVFRRGPSRWWHLLRWHLDTGVLEPGAWFHGILYPRRSDLSPDGQLLVYFALKGGPQDFLGGTYGAISKPPWLHALAAWRELGTWTRGYHFAPPTPRPERRPRRPVPPSTAPPEPRPGPPGAPPPAPPERRPRRPVARQTPPERRPRRPVAPDGDLRVEHGSLPPLPWPLRLTPVAQYAAELRRGWVEHETCPPRAADDTWDERREVVLARARPGGSERLVLRDRGWDPEHAIEGRHPVYSIEDGRHAGPLADVQWADWDGRGRLLVATSGGQLEVRDLRQRVITVDVAHDLSSLTPEPAPAPAWARAW